MSDDLIGFLAERLDGPEMMQPTPGRAELDDLRFELKRGDPYEQHLSSRIEDGLDAQTEAWLALQRREIAAKRAILAEHQPVPSRGPDGPVCGTCVTSGLTAATEVNWPCPTVRQIAAVYNDHPDYRDEWKS